MPVKLGLVLIWTLNTEHTAKRCESSVLPGAPEGRPSDPIAPRRGAGLLNSFLPLISSLPRGTLRACLAPAGRRTACSQSLLMGADLRRGGNGGVPWSVSQQHRLSRRPLPDGIPYLGEEQGAVI